MDLSRKLILRFHNGVKHCLLSDMTLNLSVLKFLPGYFCDHHFSLWWGFLTQLVSDKSLIWFKNKIHPQQITLNFPCFALNFKWNVWSENKFMKPRKKPPSLKIMKSDHLSRTRKFGREINDIKAEETQSFGNVLTYQFSFP